ncbi:MAG: EamA family transporter [Chloroflexi bacterium]|nr:EamA family transporter [Chloroflexota bacterium]
MAVKAALEELAPVSLTIARHLVASAAFLLLLPFLGVRFRALPVRDLPRLLIVGLCAVGSGITIPFGQALVPAGVASLIVTTSPVFTGILSFVFLRERLGTVRSAGISLAFAGLLVMFLLADSGSGSGSASVAGFLLMLAAPVCWSLYTVAGKSIVSRYPPMIATAYVFVLGTIGFLPLMFVLGAMDFFPPTLSSMEGDLVHLSLKGWALLLYTAIGPLVIGYGLWYRALKRLEPSQVAVYMYLVPLFGVASSSLLLGEPVTLSIIFGGAAIIGGVVLANL